MAHPAPSPAAAPSRRAFILTETSAGGCCCYGGDEVSVKAFATREGARAALRASLARWCPYAPDYDGTPRALCDLVYKTTYSGPPEGCEAAIAALYRGEAVEDQFDFYKLNVRGGIMDFDQPLWEETWSWAPFRDGQARGGCCKISRPMTADDHGGVTRVSMLTIAEVELPDMPTTAA